MASSSELTERLVQSLLDRVKETRFPSAEMEDRVEASITTVEEQAEYAEALVAKVEGTHFPSRHLLDRARSAIAKLERAGG